MRVESTPKFTDSASRLWDVIPLERRKSLLSSVWCGRCRHEVTIANFTGVEKAGDLLLVGKCTECHDDVAKLIEMV